jgi:hypothetical protein
MGGSFRNPNRGSGKSIGLQLMAGFCAHVLLFNSLIRNSGLASSQFTGEKQQRQS